jgi:peptide deformylase
MIYRIFTYPTDREMLRRKARPVREDEFDEELATLAANMIETMIAHNGYGLARTQVRASEESEPLNPYAVFIMFSDDGPIAVVNPEIVEKTMNMLGNEACLSFPGVSTEVEAPMMIRMRFRTVNGEEREETFRNMQARCAFHEDGHLRGELLIDRLGSFRKRAFLKALNEKAER